MILGLSIIYYLSLSWFGIYKEGFINGVGYSKFKLHKLVGIA